VSGGSLPVEKLAEKTYRSYKNLKFPSLYTQTESDIYVQF